MMVTTELWLEWLRHSTQLDSWMFISHISTPDSTLAESNCDLTSPGMMRSQCKHELKRRCRFCRYSSVWTVLHCPWLIDARTVFSRRLKTHLFTVTLLDFVICDCACNFNVINHPVASDRQRLSCDVCLEVRGEIITTVLCCIVYWSCASSEAHLDEQFLQFSGLKVGLIVVSLWARWGGSDGIEA